MSITEFASSSEFRQAIAVNQSVFYRNCPGLYIMLNCAFPGFVRQRLYAGSGTGNGPVRRLC